MYKDIINYELAEGKTEAHLLKVAERILTEWMRNQPGFIKWEIHKNANGHYTDIVHWKSQEDAKNSEKEMANIQNASEWFECYKEGSISSKNITLIGEFNP